MAINKMSEAEFEKIEQYILGKMDIEAQKAFEIELSNNQQLQDEVEEVRLQIQAIEEASFKDELDQIHASMSADGTQVVPMSSAPVKRKANWWAIAAAFIGIVGLGIWFVNRAPSHEQLYAQYFKPDPGLVTPMGNTDNYEFYRAMVDYKQEKYEAAFDRWNKIYPNKPNNDSLNYFMGMSLMALEKSDEAIPYLEKVSETDQSVFQNEMSFYLGLAELKNGNTDKAIEWLKKSNLKDAKTVIEKITP